LTNNRSRRGYGLVRTAYGWRAKPRESAKGGLEREWLRTCAMRPIKTNARHSPERRRCPPTRGTMTIRTTCLTPAGNRTGGSI